MRLLSSNTTNKEMISALVQDAKKNDCKGQKKLLVQKWEEGGANTVLVMVQGSASNATKESSTFKQHHGYTSLAMQKKRRGSFRRE